MFWLYLQTVTLFLFTVVTHPAGWNTQDGHSRSRTVCGYPQCMPPSWRRQLWLLFCWGWRNSYRGLFLDGCWMAPHPVDVVRLLVSLPSSLPAEVGMMGWEGRRSGMSANSPRSFCGCRIVKCLLVKIGWEMDSLGLGLGGAGDLSQGLNRPRSGRAGRALLLHTHTHTHTHIHTIRSRDLISSTVDNGYTRILTTWDHFNNIMHFLIVYRLIHWPQFTLWSLWILEC
jgi:hypothetical protein